MIPPSANPMVTAHRILLFGPQALAVDSKAFHKLGTQLQNKSYAWVLAVLSALPSLWNELAQRVPKLQSSNGGKLLDGLNEAVRTCNIPESLFPLPNVLLSPLTVIIHLTQYSAFLKAALHDLNDISELSSSITNSAETSGLCTGILSAFAAGCASTLAELQEYGTTAVRLAMLVGALVDADESSPESGGTSVSFSVSWKSSESINSVRDILKRYPEAYISIFMDERRSTITAPKHMASSLVELFKANGVHVVDLPLFGRFHWSERQEAVEELIAFCDQDPRFQFSAASKMVFPCPIHAESQSSSGSLHETALREILLRPSKWIESFSALYTSHLTTEESKVICFGPERCVPPTIARKLGSRLVHISDIDLTKTNLAASLIGRNSASSSNDLSDERIAVIGMSGHFPGAKDLEDFWDVLASGISQHKEVPKERFPMETAWRELEPNRKWYGNFMEDFDTFDHKFFKKSPREMSSTDPQHRVILQLAYQAVEQSGYFGKKDTNKHVGCYMGVGNNEYNRNIACHPATAYSATGNLRSFIAGKVSHYFGWTGPSLTIDTACSSSAVAIHHACRAILHGECATALAGGVNVVTNAEWFQNLAGASFLSPTGQCKPFDAKGDGYCRGEAAGAVLLKKLSTAIADGDQIFGVIASTRVYQNQNCTAITVPNALSLSDLFVDVLQHAQVPPHTVSVVEAHGTGTAVGDPVEYDAIRQVMGGPGRSDTLSLSSVKGHVGHTEFASGVVSLLKILLMINKQSIPPQASFTSINPSLKATPEDKIEILTRLQPWNADFRAALINNYGASGSNASMVITQAPGLQSKSSNRASLAEETAPFWLCGLDEDSLRTYVAKFRKLLNLHHNRSGQELSVGNLSFQVSRQSNRSLPHGLIFSARTRQDLDQKLAAYESGDKASAVGNLQSNRPVILCFGGQISTYVGLDKEVYDRAAVLRDHLDQCNATCLSLGLESIYPDIFQKTPIQDVVKFHTALFATQYSCAKTWIDCGVEVAAVVGHSFGELAALCVSGAFSLQDALTLVSGRAGLIKKCWGEDRGAMLAVEADFAAVNALLSKTKLASKGKTGLAIACYNGPRSFTIAGPTASIDAAADMAKTDPIFSQMKSKKLNVTNAFHSTLVEPLVDGLNKLGEVLTFNEPTLQFEQAAEEQRTAKLDGSFVAKHMRNPVFFNHAVQRLSKDFPNAIWLEAGSNSTITNMAGRALGSPSSAHFQPVNVTSEGSWQFLVDTTAKLWKEGLNVSFWAHHAKQVSDYTPIILPPYQFERSKHWLDLKAPPKVEVPVVQQALPVEEPKGLTSLLGYQDTERRHARFRINTNVDKFQQSLEANLVLKTATVTPSFLQLEIAIDALMSLRSEFKDASFQPQLQGMLHHNVFVVDPVKAAHLEVIAIDDAQLVWEWNINATDASGSVTALTSGTIVFKPAGDSQLKDSFQSLARLSGRKRCASILEGNLDDDLEVLQGRNIYRAFEQVVDYKEILRHMKKLVGTENESAGRIAKAYESEAWIDSILTESFCQVAGIYVNLMTSASDLSERGVFIFEKMERWMRNPARADSSLPKTWDVFAVHHNESDSKYVSDIFAFDPRDGSLVEVILGVTYSKVPLESFRKVLARAAQIDLRAAAAPITTIPEQVQITLPVNQTSNPDSASPIKSKKKKAPKKPKSTGPDFSTKTREIVCNLCGLEPDEVKDDSDLIELGIDSLMAMELVREVEAVFKCTLQNEQLMELTDFTSLVVCIRSTLGFEDQLASEDEASSEDEEERAPKINGVNSHANGDNGTNGTNGAAVAHNVNGHALYSDKDYVLPPSTVLDVFREVKWTTDDFIVKGQLDTYYDKVMPRSTELVIVYILDAFENLGCNIRTAAPGQELQRVPYLPKHERFMNYIIYSLLEKEARLIDIHGSKMVRTAVAPPTKPAETLLEELLRDEPVHAAEHKLTALIGPKFADCLSGKQDGLQLIFGSAEGKEIVTDMYANSPVTGIWIHQLVYFVEQLVSKLPKDGEPLCILEMGAGTGGTTSQVAPLLARLGVPIKYTMTDLSGSLVAAGRKRFKKYPFMEFKLLDIEAEPDQKFLESQHIIFATNCVHATRNLTISLTNINRMLRPDGFLMLLEMTEQAPWCDFIFGLLEGWWLFEDDREYVLAPAEYWERTLHSVGYGHVDWSEGTMPESHLQRLIIAHASGPKYERGVRPPSPPKPAPTLPDITERQAVIDAYITKYTKDFAPPAISNGVRNGTASSGTCVLVTGATGSLGGQIVANIAQLPDVDTVVCLNRLSTMEAEARQQKFFEMRGILLEPAYMSKLQVVNTDTSKPMLGLSPETYQGLVRSVTHVIHSAWPMSLTRPVRMYESQFKAFRNLIDFACEITNYRPSPFKLGFQFISSLAVVANYPLLTGEAVVPEQPMTVATVPEGGYADAKLACEHILARTLFRHPDRFHAKLVRIAQISGSTSNGHWNPTEYMPFLIKSSQVLKIIPDLEGTLSWYPVDLVAATIGELLLSESATDLVYHIDNPSRQPWKEMIATLARALEIPSKDIVPYQQWIDRVRRFRASTTDNPAVQLEEFFLHYFIPMSCGGLLLETTKTKEQSKTMKEIGPVDGPLVEKYIARWKQTGFLNQ